MRRLNMFTFAVHGVGWGVISVLPHYPQWVTAFAGFVSGLSFAFLLATYMDRRNKCTSAGRY